MTATFQWVSLCTASDASSTAAPGRTSERREEVDVMWVAFPGGGDVEEKALGSRVKEGRCERTQADSSPSSGLKNRKSRSEGTDSRGTFSCS